MFVVNGRVTAVKELTDGRFAYSRGLQKPAAILTREQLEEIQRLNGIRLVLPYIFLALGGIIIFILINDQLPLAASIAVGVIAIALSAYAIITTTIRVGKILDQATSEPELPARIPRAMIFRTLWRSSSDRHVLLGKWFWGCMSVVSIAVIAARFLKFDDHLSPTDTVAMLIFAILSSVLFQAFSTERQRRKSATGPEKS
ncbi:hypothetical protein [Mesorhizobium sp. NZP2234]|uniref:hypothetical protein n=1 Tax=Mesorhizobium sp. NZP2234 TaxID=2483402 RepID=UPI0015547ED4|nr:hypothetical protein [Mesorhizobium sp. NZP2234]